MTIVLIFISVVFLALINKGRFIQLAILLLCLFFSCRNELVPDTANYMAMYEQGLDFPENIEIGYLYLCHFFKNVVHFPFQLFLFVIELFLFESWYFISSRLIGKKIINGAFILFVSYYGFFFFGIVLRAAIAITICFWAIYFLLTKSNKTRFILYYVLVCISALIHVGGLLFLVAPLLNKHLSKKLLYLVIICAVVIMFILNGGFISSYIERFSAIISMGRASSYIENYDNEVSISILTWINYAIAFFIVFFREKKAVQYTTSKYLDFFINLCVFAVLINSLFFRFYSGARLSMQWSFFEFIPLISLSSYSRAKWKIVLVYSLVKFVALIHYYPLILNYSF